MNNKFCYDFPLPRQFGYWKRIQLWALMRRATSERIHRLGSFWVCESPESHVGASRWAIDFLVPDGTPVLAAADGCVVAVKDDSREWGASKDFSDKANYVVIDHGGEFSQYCHLAFPTKGVLRRSPQMYPGKSVKKGECIGHVGKTGWTTIDHLHFMVFRCAENPEGFESVRVIFVS